MTCRLGVPHQDLDPGIPVCQWSSTPRPRILAGPQAMLVTGATHCPARAEPLQVRPPPPRKTPFLLGHSWWLTTSLVLDLPLSFALPHTPGAESPCESRHSYILTDFYISFLNSSIWCTGGWRNIEGVHNPALPNEANNILEIDE